MERVDLERFMGDWWQIKIAAVKEGALADLLLVEGNPQENLDLVANPEDNPAPMLGYRRQ